MEGLLYIVVATTIQPPLYLHTNIYNTATSRGCTCPRLQLANNTDPTTLSYNDSTRPRQFIHNPSSHLQRATTTPPLRRGCVLKSTAPRVTTLPGRRRRYTVLRCRFDLQRIRRLLLTSFTARLLYDTVPMYNADQAQSRGPSVHLQRVHLQPTRTPPPHPQTILPSDSFVRCTPSAYNTTTLSYNISLQRGPPARRLPIVHRGAYNASAFPDNNPSPHTNNHPSQSIYNTTTCTPAYCTSGNVQQPIAL